MSELFKAARSCLEKNGGPIDAEETRDGQAYVMVRRVDFDALEVAVKNGCELCHGTGKRVPSYVNLSDPCPCRTK